MAALKAGDKFPEGVTFSYVPYDTASASLNVCGRPITYDASKEFADKKVVIVSVPGAFTPTCSERHVPPFLENVDKLKAKGADVLAILASNDAFVMSAWQKALGATDSIIVFLSDADAQFSGKLGWTTPDGKRTARYAMIVDHGVVKYADIEKAREVTVSGYDAVLAKL